MAPRKKKTHLSQGKKYGGSPRELPDDDLPTYADVARCFYTICKKNHNFKMQVKTVQENVMNVWKKCCSHLPLLLGASVFLKLVRFLTHVKQINKTLPKSYTLKYYEYKKEHIFDIATCRCDLPVVTCDIVHCASVNCQEVHIQCHCDAKRSAPEEERAYLRSQRARGRKEMDQADKDYVRKMAALEKKYMMPYKSRLSQCFEKILPLQQTSEVRF